MTRSSEAQWSPWERILMTGRTISTLGDTIAHTPHTASEVHGTGAGTTTLGTGMPGHIIHGTTGTGDGMEDGTIRGMEEVSLTHGITAIEAGMIRSMDICTLITADGMEDGTLTGTIITTTSCILHQAMTMAGKYTGDRESRLKATGSLRATGSLQAPQAQRQEE